jgi:hypothetical protein
MSDQKRPCGHVWRNNDFDCFDCFDCIAEAHKQETDKLRATLRGTYRQLQSIVTTWHNENHGRGVANNCSRVGCIESIGILEAARRELEKN